MTWTGQSFTLNQILTSTQMNNLQADITAQANGDSGAPKQQTAGIADSAITTVKINDGAVTQAKIGSGAVHQGELDTTTQDMDHTATVNNSTSTLTTLMTSAQYFLGFKYYSPDSSSASAFVQCYVQEERGQTNFGTNDCYGKVGVRDTGTYVDLTVESEWRYVTASGPFDLGDGEVPYFVYVLLKDGKPVGVSSCTIPPWAYNGPTDITPDRVVTQSDGSLIKFKNVTEVSDDGEISITEKAIDMDMKNADMNLYPHPFLYPENSGYSVLLLDPVSTLQLLEYRSANVKPSQLLFKDYLRIDNTPLSRELPDGVQAFSYRWKNSRTKAGEMIKERREKLGPFAEIGDIV